MDLKTCRVLVTPTSFGKNDPHLFSEIESQAGEVIYNPTKRPLTSTEVRNLLPGVDGYLAGLDTIDQHALEAADKLKVIARYGVGLDNVDLACAKEKGITVTYTPGANAISVAELTIGLILCLARHIPKAAAATRLGEWPRWSGMTLQGKSVGLVGLGAIGKQITLRLAGFDCRILAYDPYPDLEFISNHKVGLLMMDDLLHQADFVSLHLPLLPDTREIVNAEFLSNMKPGSYLVNTARGELIHEASLIKALQSGLLAGAALDVFSTEPPSATNPILTLPNVIVTPHSASHTDGATNAMGWMALNDCLAVLRGEQPKYPVM
jgi:phosphoglycerate dehydrogenase-like enzyme